MTGAASPAGAPAKPAATDFKLDPSRFFGGHDIEAVNRYAQGDLGDTANFTKLQRQFPQFNRQIRDSLQGVPAGSPDEFPRIQAASRDFFGKQLRHFDHAKGLGRAPDIASPEYAAYVRDTAGNIPIDSPEYRDFLSRHAKAFDPYTAARMYTPMTMAAQGREANLAEADRFGAGAWALGATPTHLDSGKMYEHYRGEGMSPETAAATAARDRNNMLPPTTVESHQNAGEANARIRASEQQLRTGKIDQAAHAKNVAEAETLANRAPTAPTIAQLNNPLSAHNLVRVPGQAAMSTAGGLGQAAFGALALPGAALADVVEGGQHGRTSGALRDVTAPVLNPLNRVTGFNAGDSLGPSLSQQVTDTGGAMMNAARDPALARAQLQQMRGFAQNRPDSATMKMLADSAAGNGPIDSAEAGQAIADLKGQADAAQSLPGMQGAQALADNTPGAARPLLRGAGAALSVAPTVAGLLASGGAGSAAKPTTLGGKAVAMAPGMFRARALPAAGGLASRLNTGASNLAGNMAKFTGIDPVAAGGQQVLDQTPTGVSRQGKIVADADRALAAGEIDQATRDQLVADAPNAPSKTVGDFQRGAADWMRANTSQNPNIKNPLLRAGATAIGETGAYLTENAPTAAAAIASGRGLNMLGDKLKNPRLTGLGGQAAGMGRTVATDLTNPLVAAGTELVPTRDGSQTMGMAEAKRMGHIDPQDRLRSPEVELAATQQAARGMTQQQRQPQPLQEPTNPNIPGQPQGGAGAPQGGDGNSQIDTSAPPPEQEVRALVGNDPEAAAQAAQTALSGNPDAPGMQDTLGRLQEQLGASAEQAWQWFDGLDDGSKILLTLGLGVGALGVIQGASNGDVMGWLTGALGLAGAAGVAANGGAFGPETQQFVQNLFTGGEQAKHPQLSAGQPAATAATNQQPPALPQDAATPAATPSTLANLREGGVSRGEAAQLMNSPELRAEAMGLPDAELSKLLTEAVAADPAVGAQLKSLGTHGTGPYREEILQALSQPSGQQTSVGPWGFSQSVPGMGLTPAQAARLVSLSGGL